MVFENPLWFVLALATLVFVIVTIINVARSRLNPALKAVWFFLAFTVFWSAIWWLYVKPRQTRRRSSRRRR